MNLQALIAELADQRNGGRLVWVAARSRMKRFAASRIHFP
jgi:vacuolar-type H+-ATPase subunit E/Vma4